MSLLSLVVYSVLSEERGGGSSSHVLTGSFTNALGWFAVPDGRGRQPLSSHGDHPLTAQC